MYFNYKQIRKKLGEFKGGIPFDHCVIDDFLIDDVVRRIESEFIAYDDKRWYCYKNAIEDKKALNDWNAFPEVTYRVFRELISEDFLNVLREELDLKLYQDPGLHGGGWHVHGPGGNLNPHLDYSIHPKARLQRKLNIILYVSSDLKDEHGGHLGLWCHDEKNNAPGDLVKTIAPKYNRAVIFDTTQNSWHGMSSPLVQPEGIYRKSLAVYYLTDVPSNADHREKALFAPREEQKGESSIEELIAKRADSKEFSTVYRKN